MATGKFAQAFPAHLILRPGHLKHAAGDDSSFFGAEGLSRLAVALQQVTVPPGAVVNFPEDALLGAGPALDLSGSRDEDRFQLLDARTRWPPGDQNTVSMQPPFGGDLQSKRIWNRHAGCLQSPIEVVSEESCGASTSHQCLLPSCRERQSDSEALVTSCCFDRCKEPLIRGQPIPARDLVIAWV